MGYVEEFFEKIDLAIVESFVVEPRRCEDLHLEFTIAPNGLDKDAAIKLAKALSGFANSDGGVLVWGVSAEKDSDGVDVAHALKPIKKLTKFISDLQSRTGEAVFPLLDGVLHRAILLDADRGYAATLVPASERPPHMAKCGEYRYYKRSGDSFYKMEHSDVEDMFGRRPKPKLCLFTSLGWGETGHTYMDIRVTLGLENSGRGVARSLSLWLKKPERDGYRFEWDAYRFASGLGFKVAHTWPKEDTEASCFVSEPGLVIHPDTRCAVTALVIRVPRGDDNAPDLVMDCQISADGAMNVREMLTLPGRDVVAKATEYWKGNP